MDHIDTSEIRKVFHLAEKLKDPINLSIGLPHYPTPAPIIAALQKALIDGKTSYTHTQGIVPLREKIAEKFQVKNGFKTEVDNILISSGVASLIQLLFMTCIEKGDKILLFDPSFLIYTSLAHFFGAEIVVLPENFTKSHIEQLDPAVKEGIKFIIFSTPF